MSLETSRKNWRRTSDYMWIPGWVHDKSRRAASYERINHLAGSNFSRGFSELYGGKEIIFKNNAGDEVEMCVGPVISLNHGGSYGVSLVKKGSNPGHEGFCTIPVMEVTWESPTGQTYNIDVTTVEKDHVLGYRGMFPDSKGSALLTEMLRY